MADPTETRLPLYRRALDWEWFDREFPAPDVWAETVFKWPADRVREPPPDAVVAAVSGLDSGCRSAQGPRRQDSLLTEVHGAVDVDHHAGDIARGQRRYGAG